jgi:septal ring factor EnvC (AmiA/AmiB activator)
MKVTTGAESQIDHLIERIDDLAAYTARLQTQAKDLGNEVAQNHKHLHQANATCRKQKAKHRAETQELLVCVSASTVFVNKMSNQTLLLPRPY